MLAPEIRTHVQKVCNLYKRALRTIEAFYGGSTNGRIVTRYHQVLLRARFDDHRCEKDKKEARRLYYVGEDELFLKTHPLPPARFATSIGYAGGVAYARVVEPSDWVLDYWHPLEKAQYPEYFKRRECRKCQYIKHWEKGTLY